MFIYSLCSKWKLSYLWKTKRKKKVESFIFILEKTSCNHIQIVFYIILILQYGKSILNMKVQYIKSSSSEKHGARDLNRNSLIPVFNSNIETIPRPTDQLPHPSHKYCSWKHYYIRFLILQLSIEQLLFPWKHRIKNYKIKQDNVSWLCP